MSSKVKTPLLLFFWGAPFPECAELLGLRTSPAGNRTNYKSCSRTDYRVARVVNDNSQKGSPAPVYDGREKMKLPRDFPRRVHVMFGERAGGFFMNTVLALELLRSRQAREVFADTGKFLGILLEKQPAESAHYMPESLPPLELPGLFFNPPAYVRANKPMVRHRLSDIGLMAGAKTKAVWVSTHVPFCNRLQNLSK
jgi:hypothetical protein